jgi:carbon storage regulator CsrA
MLVLTRKSRESVVIGRREDLEPTVVVTVLEITAGRVRLGFQSDIGTPIHRHEVWERIRNGDGRDGNGSGSPLLSNGLAVPT